MEKDQQPLCKTCAFAELHNDVLFCHFNPPVGVLMQSIPHTAMRLPNSPAPQPVPTSFFPPVQPESWCGQWEEYGEDDGDGEGEKKSAPVASPKLVAVK